MPNQNHPNLGLCIDTAHPPLAPAYGWDPTTGKGWTDKQYASFLERLRAVPKEKIFYVELSEVLKPVVPLGKGSPFDQWREKAQSPRGDGFVWAVCGRPVPLVGRDAGRGVKGPDDMGAARALETFKAVLSTGWRGESLFEYMIPFSICSKTDELHRYLHVRVLRSSSHGTRRSRNSLQVRRRLCLVQQEDP